MPWVKPASTKQRIENWYYDRFHRDVVRVLEEQGGLNQESLIIEFGCDRGLLAHYLQGRCRRLILSDLSDRRETAASLACEFHLARAEASGLDSGSLDLIIMISVYHHLSDFEGSTKEVARVLKPHGKLVLVEPIKSHPFTMFLNTIAPWVHPGDPNWTEPYGLALWVNRSFINQQFSVGFRRGYLAKLDNCLWGLNPFLPKPILKMYFRFQQLTKVANTEIHIFEKEDAPSMNRTPPVA